MASGDVIFILNSFIITSHLINYLDVIFIFTAPTPNEAILRNVFENTTDLDRLCNFLSMPRDKRDVDSAVEYYARSTNPVKMRRIIFILDLMGNTALADSLMDYAEPPAGTVGVKKSGQK